MLSPEALAALDRLPAREALRSSLTPEDTGTRRAARLLAGDDGSASSMTVGDALFRWARVEPEALAEADVVRLKQMSDMVGVVGRIPNRFCLVSEAERSIVALDCEANDGSVLATARRYLIQRLFAHLFDAQGCEVSICAAEAHPTAILLNGLQAVVHDPQQGPPTKIDRLTFVTQDILHRVGGLAANPLVFPLVGMGSDTLGALLPAGDVSGSVIGYGPEICLYANAAANAARMLLRRDTDAMTNLASLASVRLAAHLGHVAGQAAAVALLGLTGSWIVVVAPVAAGFGGRVLVKGMLRRARYEILCRHEVTALRDAVSLHCIASRDALQANAKVAETQMLTFREMHGSASGRVKEVIADWLDRLQQILEFRNHNVDRLHRASIQPNILDPRGGDPVAAAQESILICARVGLHPANLATTCDGIVAASKALERRMKLAMA